MILIDNTVLSNFALVGELILLKDYCQGKGATTEYVLAEFERGIKEGIFINTNLDWLKNLALVDVKESSLFKTLSKRLGAGEASCLAIAMYREYDLLSDDMAVRKVALREKVRISGSIGVLLELIRIEKINLEKGNKILRNFIKYGYFSPVDRLNELL
jgi:predicted nucleic acid-binding protein